MTESATTHFGFRDVPVGEKAEMVRQVFDSVAGRYDLMNDLMSLGIHRLWKDALMDWIAPRPDLALLDVAGGTGDIAFRYRARGGGPVTVCDINEAMLTVGRERAAEKGIDGLTWIVGNAEILPVESNSVDLYTIAFGLRNVTDIDAALREAKRVLKPGGRFLCLEFSRLAIPALDPVYDFYSFKVLPEIGARVADDREAYQYLAESIRKFPDQESFVERIGATGLGRIRYRNLSGGIAAIHSAWKL
ncbi:MAG: bifunctional demethylmenaquinone methyltransferase/2-methoxy-6-polyprenyl-1,4-benzoquinol methylase UbiE [Nisaea sp.]|uniref:bifunctional demethylmenaquinone methyltransferase/2-methoxy-6-polyprenyl-1,4-benzoquinol methylase UbiE n=1 Tax=Nisaea sp. TaxID=2024842 RepID=UPI001B158298|nr:bifunctional demethylmenaquinone methyltransferase/2-methoxy-6-polyprenyl-1,4-benzoquinol methylase UbiE [Nisaea sp.]MBO6560548.1 bifunctional demethylmenaquinone methyltransferase/2-methoxy-6-polyprenyl-1,4-benzoquinol methylase UbiE [Nisaea sp.]